MLLSVAMETDWVRGLPWKLSGCSSWLIATIHTPTSDSHTHTHTRICIFWLFHIWISIIPIKTPISPDPVHILTGIISFPEEQKERGWKLANRHRPQGWGARHGGLPPHRDAVALVMAESRAAADIQKKEAWWSPRSLCRSRKSMSPGRFARFQRILSARQWTYWQKCVILDFIFRVICFRVHATNPGFHNNTHLTNIFLFWILGSSILKFRRQLISYRGDIYEYSSGDVNK